LEELVVQGAFTGLFRLLLKRTGTKLGLRRTKGVLLGLTTQASEGLRRSSPHAVYALSKARQLACRASAHTVQLLGQSRLLCRLSGTLTEALLTQLGKVLAQAGLLGVLLLAETSHGLCRANALTVALLADTKHLIGTLLEGRAISLSGTQTKLLLLLGRTQSLTIALVHKTGDRLAGSQVLLAGQISLRDATAITAKRTLSNLVTQKARLFLTLLLAQVSHSRTDDAVQIRGHVLIDLLPTKRTSINSLSTGSSKSGRHALIRLRPGIGTGNACGSGLIVGLRDL
jgi:hypothetical protein